MRWCHLRGLPHPFCEFCLYAFIFYSIVNFNVCAYLMFWSFTLQNDFHVSNMTELEHRVALSSRKSRAWSILPKFEDCNLLKFNSCQKCPQELDYTIIIKRFHKRQWAGWLKLAHSEDSNVFEGCAITTGAGFVKDACTFNYSGGYGSGMLAFITKLQTCGFHIYCSS